MVDVGTIGAIIALLTGVAGMVIAITKVGPERTNVIVTYQAAVLDDLREENERLQKVNENLASRISELEREVDTQRNKRQEVERRLRHLEELGARFEASERRTKNGD
jgi:uncharacterized protein YlxW (UPF0749 family)